MPKPNKKLIEKFLNKDVALLAKKAHPKLSKAKAIEKTIAEVRSYEEFGVSKKNIIFPVTPKDPDFQVLEAKTGNKYGKLKGLGWETAESGQGNTIYMFPAPQHNAINLSMQSWGKDSRFFKTMVSPDDIEVKDDHVEINATIEVWPTDDPEILVDFKSWLKKALSPDADDENDEEEDVDDDEEAEFDLDDVVSDEDDLELLADAEYSVEDLSKAKISDLTDLGIDKADARAYKKEAKELLE